MKCRLPQREVETEERYLKFNFDILKGRRPYIRIDYFYSRLAELIGKVNDFNRLVERNNELAVYDPKLTGLQRSVIHNLTGQLRFEVHSFRQDEMIIKDLC